MYTKQILAASLIILSVQASRAGFHAVRLDGFKSAGAGDSLASVPVKPRSFDVVDDKSLRQYIVENVANIKKVSTSSDFSVQQKLDYIQSTVETVSKYRSTHWSRSAYVEHELDLMIKPFESFPAGGEFQAKRCDQYQNRLLLDWEPGAEDAGPSQSGVADALQTLKQICKG